MLPGGLAAPLVLLLAANDTAMLDCVCRHIADVSRAAGLRSLSSGERLLRRDFCSLRGDYRLTEECGTLLPPSAAVPAVARLVPRSWGPPPPPSTTGGQVQVEGERRAEGSCGGTAVAVSRLSVTTARPLYAELISVIPADCVRSCPVPGLNETEWNVTTLAADDVRRPVLSQQLESVRRIGKAITTSSSLLWSLKPWRLGKREIQAESPQYLGQVSSYWRGTVQLLTLGVAHIAHLFIPLAFEHTANNTSEQRINEWIKDLERVRDILDTRFRGWVRDMQWASNQTVNYKIEENRNKSGKYVIRLPLLGEGLVQYQEPYLSLREDFSAPCEALHPGTSQVWGLADAVYSFYYENWLQRVLEFSGRSAGLLKIVGAEWQLEDQSDASLFADTGCLQLLADALDHPACPLEEPPPESSGRRRRCRLQLWQDLVQRSPHTPVTSYLAYTQRARVSLCLLAWMVANSLGICQDVPFSMIQSVHDARCYFDNPDNQSCLQSHATDAICSVSRAVLFLKCHDFTSTNSPKDCSVKFNTDGSYSAIDNGTWLDFFEGNLKPTKRTLNYKHSLNSAVLKYKDFKIDRLKPLEILSIVINILFRFLSIGVYMYLPHLRNLPGKLLLSFQITGVVQVLCSEVLYRMAGFPDLSTAVLIDSGLTFLSCLWLNSFCYQMYTYARYLRLPNNLLPVEASLIFRRQLLYTLMPCIVVCTTSIGLEKTSTYYLFFSRLIFIVGISLSVSFNLLCLGIVSYMYLRNKKSMAQLKIFSSGKFCSKTQFLYMSVKAVILSGIGIIIRIGFHQAQGIAQFVYYVHLATMVQGPVQFIFFVCNGTTLPVLRERAVACWKPERFRPKRGRSSAAERNRAKRNNPQPAVAESSL